MAKGRTRYKGDAKFVDPSSIEFWDGKAIPEDQEVWAFVSECDSLYMVSNYGRVIRVAGGRGAQVGRLLTPAPEIQKGKPTGYLIVGLKRADGKRINYYLHRLVAIHFHPTEHQWCDVHHIDHNPANCRADNLEWQDSLEHRQQAYAEFQRHGGYGTGRRYGRTGT